MNDEVADALDRNAVIRDSALEKLVRENAYYVAGIDFDDPKRAEKFDTFIQAQRRDPTYASCFEQSQHRAKADEVKKSPVDTLDLTVAQFKEIVNGTLRVEKAG